MIISFVFLLFVLNILNFKYSNCDSYLDLLNLDDEVIFEKDSLHGKVYSGNYTYFRLISTGRLKLVLETTYGDADIYVSSFKENPTFDLNTHDFQSATCGLDIISIHEDFKRPFTVAIYGHPSSEISQYIFTVIILSNNKESSNYLDETAIYKKDKEYISSKENEFKKNKHDWDPIIQLISDILHSVLFIIVEVLNIIL